MITSCEQKQNGSEAVSFERRLVVNTSLIQYSTTKQFRSNQSMSTLVWYVFVGRGVNNQNVSVNFNDLLYAFPHIASQHQHLAQRVKPHRSMNIPVYHIVNNFLFTMTGEGVLWLHSPVIVRHPFVRHSLTREHMMLHIDIIHVNR